MYASFAGRQYRCVVTDENGSTCTSDPTTLALGFAITEEPEDSVEAAVGDSITLKVVASGTGLTYQWQYSKDEGETWITCTSSSAKKASFKFSMYKTFADRQYRCVVTDGEGNTLTTDPCTLVLVK